MEYVEEPRPMSGSEIANMLSISRMAVSQSLKRSIKKIYISMRRSNRLMEPFDIAVQMSQILRVSLDSETEMNKFFNLFPPDLKMEIKGNAKNRIR